MKSLFVFIFACILAAIVHGPAAVAQTPPPNDTTVQYWRQLLDEANGRFVDVAKKLNDAQLEIDQLKRLLDNKKKIEDLAVPKKAP